MCHPALTEPIQGEVLAHQQPERKCSRLLAFKAIKAWAQIPIQKSRAQDFPDPCYPSARAAIRGNRAAFCLLRARGVKVGSKRIGREVLLPQPWGELRDIGGRVLADALEHIDQIGIGSMSCRRQVAIRLCAIPTYFAPTSVQQKSQLRRPIGTTRSARSRWLVSIGTSGSAR